MRPFGAGKQNLQLLLAEMFRESKLLPPLHRTLVENHLQHICKDTTPLFGCMQAIGLGHRRQIAYHFDTAVVLTAMDDVRHEMMANKEVCGVPYAKEKKRGPAGHGGKKNIYGHVEHRKVSPDPNLHCPSPNPNSTL